MLRFVFVAGRSYEAKVAEPTFGYGYQGWSMGWESGSRIHADLNKKCEEKLSECQYGRLKGKSHSDRK